jgi:hypothetical protein
VPRFAGHSPTRRQRGTAQARADQHFLVDFLKYIFGGLEFVDHSAGGLADGWLWLSWWRGWAAKPREMDG